MRIGGSFAALFLAGLVLVTAHPVTAAGPGITILRPADGATVQGTSLTVSVTVSNFRLVRPVFNHPPVLKGFAGSLQYILDSTANYVPRRDLSAATTHTWTGVTPGRHTVIVRLATSQHLPWPNGPVARTNVVVAAPVKPHGAGGASPGVGAAPTTGGGAGLTHSPLPLTLILFAALLVILGLAMLGRRLVFATASPRLQTALPSPLQSQTAIQAHSVLPAPGESNDPSREAEFQSDVFPASEPAPPAEPVISAGEESAPTANVPPQPVMGADQGFSSASFEPQKAPDVSPTPDESLTRDRAVEMARQWSGVVEGLVRQLDEQEAERHRMLDHIRMLEDRMRSAQAAREQLRTASPGISPDDFQTLRYLTDALLRDPDHIVNLAAVAQHAGKFHELVDAYARLRDALTQT